jgi:hypothetical protein
MDETKHSRSDNNDEQAMARARVLIKSEDPPRTPMEQIIELALDDAGKSLPDGEVAAVQCQVIFGDGSGHAGALKRGAFPGTYVIANQAMVQRDPRQQPQPVEGKIAEMIFLGRDVARIITIRDVPVSLVGGAGSNIWVPGS